MCEENKKNRFFVFSKKSDAYFKVLHKIWIGVIPGKRYRNVFQKEDIS